MKKLVLFGVLVVAGVSLFFILRGHSDYANLPPRAGTAWVAFGDSLTAGYGASQGADYPTVLGKDLGLPIANLGVSGQSTQEGLARVEEVLQLDPRVVLLCFGGNDTLNNVPYGDTFRNLGEIIDRLQAHGAFVVLIGIRSANVRDKYRPYFKDLAKQKRVLLVPNILAGILGNPSLMSDYVHPNEQGYAAIAERIEKVLQPLRPLLDVAPNAGG